MNNIWKKGIATAVLGIAILAQSSGANAAGLYKAKADDTFWKLSNTFGVTVNSLMQANPFVDVDNVYEGLQLVIPASATATAVKAMKAERPAQAKAAQAVAKAAPTKTAQAAKKTVTAAKTAMAKKLAAKKAAAAKIAAAKKATVKKAVARKAVAKKPERDHVTVNGKSYVYTDVMQVKASAYTAAASENGWGPVDYFGNPLKLGTIAVDPDVIPMGSKVYITGYDFNGLPSGGMIAVARDQGSAINGNRIDIFVPQSQKDASNFGFQSVKVFILD